MLSCATKQMEQHKNIENKIQLKVITVNNVSWGTELLDMFIPGTVDDFDIQLTTYKQIKSSVNYGNRVDVKPIVKYEYVLEILDPKDNILLRSSNHLSYEETGYGSDKTIARLGIKAIENSIKLKFYEFYLKTKRSCNESIVWAPISTKYFNKYSTDPFSRITQLTQNKIDSYLTPKEPIDIHSKIPPMIQNPIIPAPPTLAKSEFETNAMFKKRVTDELKKREIAIQALQEQYRKNVIERNNKIEGLKATYDKSIESIKKERVYKKANLNKKIFEFTTDAFYEVMGEPILENLKYDAETETMFADLKASNAAYSKQVSFKIPLSSAEAFKTNINSVLPIVVFSFKNNTIKLDSVQASYNKQALVATLTDKSFIPEKVEVALKDNKIKFESNDQTKLTLQNPNLIDTYSVSAINYSEKEGKHDLYNDDLSGIITQYKPKEENQKKWLFVVAVENYDYADKINYVENSAVAFKKTAQKVFGISDRNTYALIESNATAGAIEGNLSRMLENVKEGDTIYFYYSGHGVPSPASGEAYILPKDSIVDYITTKDQFQLSSMYKKLSDSKASKIISFTDCCFSGKTDNMMNFKGVAPGLIRTKSVSFNESKMVVITAGKNTQFSNQYLEKGHRLFSYYLIKSLLTRNGLDVIDIYKDLSLKVKDTSNAVGDAYRQEPQIYGNTTINLL
jgi:hypothetical protein